MTSFTVTVCLLSSAVDGDPMAAITAAMLPYDFNIDPQSFNENGEWDRWCPMSYDNFVVLPEYDDDPRLLRHPVWPNGEPRPREFFRCDGAPRGLLDVERMETIPADMVPDPWPFPTEALLTLDGRWADDRKPGPLGARHPGESEYDAYWRLADAYLRALPADAYVAQLRCHC